MELLENLIALRIKQQQHAFHLVDQSPRPALSILRTSVEAYIIVFLVGFTISTSVLYVFFYIDFSYITTIPLEMWSTR